MCSTTKNKEHDWQQSWWFKTIIGAMLVAITGVNSWACLELIEHGKEIAAIKSDRFTDKDAEKITKEISGLKEKIAGLPDVRDHERISGHPVLEGRVNAVEGDIREIRNDIRWIRREFEKKNGAH